MRLNKFIPLSAACLMAMTACSGSRVTGTYSFQMGRDKGVHAKASMNLSDKEVTYTSEGGAVTDLGKEFRLTLELQTKSDPTPAEETPAQEETSEGIDYNQIIEMLYELLGDGTAVLGYYRVGDYVKEDLRTIALGFVPSDELEELIKKILEAPEDEEITITPDMTEKLVYSTIDPKALYLTIPVSRQDLLFQLYWYGYDIYMTEEILPYIETLPEERRHSVGSHPTSDQVAEINNFDDYKAHHPNVTFRDYHTLTIGLLKE